MKPDSEKMPLVSVIIPLFNAGQYIDECLRSVINQTYKNLEIIVVDDGSNDDGPDRVRHFQRFSPVQIQLLETHGEETRGPGAARQAGVERARGAFLAFLDADDVWRKEKIEQQVVTLLTYPNVGLTYGMISFIDRDSRKTVVDRYETMGRGVSGRPINNFDMILADNVIATSSVMVRSSSLSFVGGFSAEPRHHHEDWLAWCKIAYFFDVYFLPKVLVYHRVHALSYGATLLKQQNLVEAEKNFLHLLFSFLFSHPGTDKREVSAYFRKQLARSLVRMRSWGADRKQFHRISAELGDAFPSYRPLIRSYAAMVGLVPASVMRWGRRFRRAVIGM